MSSPNPDPQRPRAILVRLSDEMHTRLERACHGEGVDPEHWVEDAIRHKLEYFES